MTRALACQGYTLFFRVYAPLSPIANSISYIRGRVFIIFDFMADNKLTNGLEL
jgi:hypothetical protein